MIALEDRRRVIERLASIVEFGMAANVHPDAIGWKLARSRFVEEIDAGVDALAVAHNGWDLFSEMFPYAQVPEEPIPDNPAGYWCGWAYARLHFETGEPLSRVILTLPVSLMAELYPVYHEMDISQLAERFWIERCASGIMARLLRESHESAADLARRSGVSMNTINYYKKSDENLFRGSYQNIYRIARALKAPLSVFLRSVE